MHRWVSLQNIMIIVAASLIYTVRLLEKQNEMGPTFKRLVIGVISARDHFLYRNAIRQTLGLLVQDMPDVELTFVLGDRECPIHPADRLSSHTCHRWYITEDTESSHIHTFFKSNNVIVNNVSMNHDCNTGLGIKILHPIILEEVSVQTNIFKGIKDILVVLEDAEEVIDSVKLTSKTCSEENGYCSIKLAAPLILPKGFEGELRVHREEMDDISLCGEDFFLLQPETKWVCEWFNSSVIEYKFVRTRKNILTKWRETTCSLVSAKFYVAEQNILMVHKKGQQQRSKEWKNHLDSLKKKVEDEEERNHDILILPLMDIYQNLPHKVMGFLDWVTSRYNASYIMKIDDDTILNIHHLEMFLKNMTNDAPSWWSQFHYHRSVPVYGKWADTDYPSLTYPTFPSGAGYLMTGSLARTVTAAKSYLTSYGGEDVSMGIWVSSVAGTAKLVDVPCWLPHPRCSHSVLVPQLSLAQMTAVWGKIHAN